MNKKMEYMEKKVNINSKVIRTEIMFAPWLIIFPMIIGTIFVYDWFTRGFLQGSSAFNGELMLGIIIIIGNILFDIPFVSSVVQYKKILAQYKEFQKKLKEIKLFNKL